MESQELIDEVRSLPVEERARLVDSLLRSLNQTDSEVDAAWAEEAKRRLSEIRDGSVETIPGEEIFEEVRNTFD